MRFAKVFTFSLLLIFVASLDGCLYVDNPSKKNCNSGLSDSDKSSSFKYCCYVDTKGVKNCVPYTQEMYDAIGKAKKSDYKDAGITIECFSSYLKMSLLSLLLFVF